MRAIKIDPVAKTITEIELAQNPNETLKELYDLIGCDLVELVQLDRGIIMAIDESVFAQGYVPTRNGKLKEIKGGFTFLGWGTVIAGTETAGYQTFPERERFTARNNLSGIFRSPTSPNTISIFKWYSVVLLSIFEIAILKSKFSEILFYKND